MEILIHHLVVLIIIKKGDDKLYFGPVWDYDLSFDNSDSLFPTNKLSKFILYYGGSAGSRRDFFHNLIKTKNVMKNIENTWIELRVGLFNFDNLNQFIEEHKEKLKDSDNLNFLKWYGSKIGKGEKDYFDSINIITNYAKKRFDTLTNLTETFDFGGKLLKINLFILDLIFIVY